jgi:hypothetical protein
MTGEGEISGSPFSKAGPLSSKATRRIVTGNRAMIRINDGFEETHGFKMTSSTVALAAVQMSAQVAVLPASDTRVPDKE